MLGVIAIEVDQECSDPILPSIKVWPTFSAAIAALVEENRQLHEESSDEPWPGTDWKVESTLDLDATDHEAGTEVFVWTDFCSYYQLIAVEAA